jgi:hypothetical protein
MAGRHREATVAADIARYEAQALDAKARRRQAKGKPAAVTRKDVETLMDSMTAEGRAHVVMQAVHALRVQPATWPR